MEIIEIVKQVDIWLFWLINSARSPFWDKFFISFTSFGNAWIAVPVLIIVAVAHIRSSPIIHVLIFIVISMSLAGIINSSIKNFVKRERPIAYFASRRAETARGGAELPDTTGREALRPHVVGPRHKHRSFPSGHANTAFSAATALFLIYGGLWWFSFIVAAVVAYSRVYLGIHFPLDTVAGALLAIIIVSAIFYLYQSKISHFSTNRHKK